MKYLQLVDHVIKSASALELTASCLRMYSAVAMESAAKLSPQAIDNAVPLSSPVPSAESSSAQVKSYVKFKNGFKR
jgi:hypothetical protein